MDQDPFRPGRREALRTAAVLLAAAVGAPFLVPGRATAMLRVRHPEPRPGITAVNVLPDSAVKLDRHKDAYQAAREIPEILDGIYCHCDCEKNRELRSLLSCFESDMPQSCGICLGEARLARRLHREGRSLAEIRVAIDRQYGPRGGSADGHRH